MAISWWHGESNDFAHFTGKSRRSLASTWHCETGAKNGPQKILFGFLAHIGPRSRRAETRVVWKRRQRLQRKEIS